GIILLATTVVAAPGLNRCITDDAHVPPPPAATAAAANDATTEKTRYSESEGHPAGGTAVLMIGLVSTLLAALANDPAIPAIFAMIGIVTGGLWFVYGVFLFASNIDHIAHNI